ncbi:4'-phosphopantetheinyl transferase superfamily protein [Acinetobacter sp.]|uniref:4'-phosphopantetheinyl transferase family protein n=1 Tax=Acinetobacter sp. TaxID=472 RepID=UPI0031DCE3FA
MIKSIQNLDVFNGVLSNFIKFKKVYFLDESKNLTIMHCEFDPNFYSDYLALELLGTELFTKIYKAVKKRKAEFLAGRVLSSFILREMGYSNLKVDISADGSPHWPLNIKGSISHSNNSVICAVSPIVKRIGVDIEYLQPTVPIDLMENVLNPGEYEFMASTGLDPSHIFSFVFSAKESLFKALYPEVNYYFDFNAARIIWLDLKTKRFKIALTLDLNDIHHKNRTYVGKFSITASHMITAIFE